MDLRAGLATCALLAGSCRAGVGDPILIPDEWSRQVVVTVPRARPEAPTIDGYVDYQEWYYASGVIGFVDADTGCLAHHPVRMNLCYDDDNVYVAVVIDRPPLHPSPRATFDQGRHDHIWWKDDAFEIVLCPGRPEKGINDYYAFCGNSSGAWSNLRGTLEGHGSDASWPGQWEYAARRAGRESWHAELAIPVAQFEKAEKPGPGAVWLLDLMNQQVTPQKKIIDLGMIWGFHAHGYSSPYKARLVFVDGGPIVRPHGLGRLKPAGDDPAETLGLRQVFYNQGEDPFTLDGHAWIFRGPAKRPEGALPFFEIWDRLLRVRETGEPVEEPGQEIQAFRSEADLLRELNERYAFLTEHAAKITVEPDGAGYFPLEVPVQPGEYLIAYRFADTATGQVMSAQVVPVGVVPGLALTLRPYFLTHQVIRAEASLRDVEVAEGDRVAFTVALGEELLDEKEAPLPEGAEAVHVFLDSRDLPEASEATISARLVGTDGQVRLTNSEGIVRPPTPEWSGNQIGRSKVVPPPFEPVRLVGNETIGLWHRRIRFGPNGLPASITARDAELLASPVDLDCSLPLVPEEAAPRLVSSDERDIIFEAGLKAENLRATVRSSTHYDGTTRLDVTLRPTAQAVTIERLALELPIAGRWARLITHTAVYTDQQRAKTEGFAGSVDEWRELYPEGAMPFTYALYLGAEDRGVQWFCESDRGWCNGDDSRVISLQQASDGATLRIAFVDQPIELTEPLHLTFGLTVTPIKDASAGRDILEAAEGHPSEEDWDEEKRAEFFQAYREAGVAQVTIYMCRDDYFGCPRPMNAENEQAIRAFAERVHREGFTVRPYAGWGVNANIPDFLTFGQEMLAEPVRNIGWGCFLQNPASPFSDWWLEGTRYLLEEVGLDGTYMDGTCLPRLILNEFDGFRWTDDDGNVHGTYPLWSIRDFIERLYILAHVESRRPGVVVLHQNCPLYFIDGFSDKRVTGEGYYHRGETVLETFSPAEFRAFYMTEPNGVFTVGLWHDWLRLPITCNEMRAMWLPHDVPMPAGGGLIRYYARHAGYDRKTQAWVRVHKIREAFRAARFVPYWGEEPVAAFDPPGPLASALVDEQAKRALVVVSNLPDQAWEGAARLDRRVLGVPDDAPCYDAMFDRELAVEADGSIRLSIEPQRYRLISVNARVPLPEGANLDETAGGG